MPHTPVRSRRLRSVLTGGAVPLLLLTGLPAQAHAQEAAVHTVRPGDSLTRISAARGVSVADLLRFNGLGLETVLYPGDELRLTGAAAPAPAAGTYTVQPNDGWWVIARRTGVSAAQLQRLNGMSASSMLHPGMVLTTQRTAAVGVVDAGGTVRYTVVSGDSLWGISQRFEVSIPRLRELNGLTRASTLHPGDVLVISDGTLEVEPVSAVQAVGDTFLGRTYAPHVTASANENLRLLRSVPQPTPEQMQQIVRETAERMGVDPRLALGHAYTESRFRMASVSPGNAVGAMQVIPITGEFASELVGRELNLLDPHDNAVAGVAFIKYVQDRTPTLDEGIGAYYQGLGGVLDSGLNPEARDYVAKVRAAMAMF
ncbi:LysM peptidoglycan-binding domain-containing protein [Micrococcus sp. RIT608]|uniref:LysM peptidoglycan-binding domain-containing protein n=1 Tax=Micrococcus sp. RIT608 TaxID=2487139 RepID=UPI000F44CF70|nr:LysM peptidoglycan-binding domain-containing protein [Micrococcus sp. RIT608]RNM10521.1 LysM peptidoglycan-binding domain-containing protein [Micrococcus sp. RIT608]